jgi:hypothetical protein
MPIPWPGILMLMEHPEALTWLARLASMGHAMPGAIGSPRARPRNEDRSVRVVSRSISRRQLQEEVTTSVARTTRQTAALALLIPAARTRHAFSQHEQGSRKRRIGPPSLASQRSPVKAVFGGVLLLEGRAGSARGGASHRAGVTASARGKLPGERASEDFRKRIRSVTWRRP